MDKLDYTIFLYPALLLCVGIIYVLCSKFSKPNFYIGYRNKLNRKNETLWKISNFVSGITFLCFAFFHCCICLALIAIKYIAHCEAQLSLLVLIVISQCLFLVEMFVVITVTNVFTAWAKKKLQSSSSSEEDY